MNKVAIVKEIRASQKEVWDFISDIERAPEWVVVMKSLTHTTDNPVKAGTVYKERSKVGPKESETTWHVTKFNEPKIQVHECNESDFRAVLTMQVEQAKNGARLIHTTEYELMPNFRPLGWILEKLFVKKAMFENLNASVRECKRLIEREGSKKN